MPRFIPNGCFLLPEGMRGDLGPVTLAKVPEHPLVEMVYIFVAGHLGYRRQAVNFVQSYQKFPANTDHQTTIVVNGGRLTDEGRKIFEPLPKVTFLAHDNSGYDIGGYQRAARESKADLMLFLGATTYFNGAGWMQRVIESFVKHGDCLYGTMGNHGDPGVGVNRHIRSTAFWITPKLFNQYPIKITKLPQRYEFEHRKRCLTEWIMKSGIPALVVTFNGEYPWEQWDNIPNGFHRGDQSALMIGDHISGPDFYPPKK